MNAKLSVSIVCIIFESRQKSCIAVNENGDCLENGEGMNEVETEVILSSYSQVQGTGPA